MQPERSTKPIDTESGTNPQQHDCKADDTNSSSLSPSSCITRTHMHSTSSSSAAAPAAAAAAAAAPSSSVATAACSSSGDNTYMVRCGNHETRFVLPSRYVLQKKLGHGAYGVVCSAYDSVSEQHVAIKKITNAFNNFNHAKRTLREIKILKRFRHENVLQVYDVLPPPSYDTFQDIYVVSELMDIDLHQIIFSQQLLTDRHIQFFLYQILRGLKYIHSAHVLHRDLKPSNLLVNENCELKICDFGLARVAEPDKNYPGFLTEYVATRWYRAPEILLSSVEYTKSVDMWSVGCIFAEMLGRKPLFPGKDYMHQLQLILHLLGTPSTDDTSYIGSEGAKRYMQSLPPRKGIALSKIFPSSNPLALDLLSKILCFVPSQRITVEEALAHPYLVDLHEPDDEPNADYKFNFDFERCPQTVQSLKALIWYDICESHPELREKPAPPLPQATNPYLYAAGQANMPAFPQAVPHHAQSMVPTDMSSSTTVLPNNANTNNNITTAAPVLAPAPASASTPITPGYRDTEMR
jgi:mitogen-activated protein kinase 6